MTVTVFGYLILISIDFNNFIPVFIFTLVLVSIKKTALNHIFKQFDLVAIYFQLSSQCLEMCSNTVFCV